ncbi:RNA dependent RNA polymerase domain-containing protein [Sarocladium implicatum]|nr:RNA dependent RNA polymerase domain-containing protein [Sarocladium implicatum]
MTSKRPKRRSREQDGQPTRRAKANKYPGQPRPYLVDALPVRTTLSPERETESAMKGTDDRAQTADFDSLVTSETAGCDASTGESGGEKQQGDRNTLFQYFENQPKTRKIIFGSTDPDLVGDSSESSPDSVFDLPDSDLDIDNDVNNTSSEPVSDDSLPSPFELRLRGIWPRFNARKAHGSAVVVPFAVRWEVQRIADHCGVDLEKVELDLGTENDWKDQSVFRDCIKKNALFANRHFPSRNDDNAWRIALDSGQKEHKAVAYIAEWSYSRGHREPLYLMRLRPLTMQKSHRMARRFGADRWLDIHMPSPASDPPTSPGCSEDDARRQIIHWLTSQRHHFLGRTWRAVFIESDKKTKKVMTNEGKVSTQYFFERVRLFATHGDDFRPLAKGDVLPPESAALLQTDRYNVSLTQLLQWAIGLNRPTNRRQLAVKLFARLKLSFSPTKSTVLLEKHQIRHVKETIGTERDMADGAGRISFALARLVAEQLGLDDVPCAFQARIGGCKGMWMIDLQTLTTEEIWLETLPSQRKFECPYDEDSHRRFEVCEWPKPLQRATINPQLIVILEQNATDRKAIRLCFEQLLAESLRQEIILLQESIDRPADIRAWVHSLGISSRDRLSHGHIKYLAGAPASREDEIATMLDSGFDLHQKYVCDLVMKSATYRAEELKDKLKITVPRSTFAYMLPDFWGFLEEGEVACSFSRQFTTSDGWSDNVLEGDVLVARLPAHTAGDVQKVRAVVLPQLRKFKDVILFSTKGSIPLADKLSGGDYDGDQAMIIWDEKIVNLFENSEPPAQPQLDLKYDKTMFADILSQESHRRRSSDQGLMNGTILDQGTQAFIEFAFDFNTRKSFLGYVTNFKEICAYNLSLIDPRVFVLSILVSQLVDAAKQGLLFCQEDWDHFKGKLGFPRFLEKPAYGNPQSKRQGRYSTKHILDWLYANMSEKLEVFLRDFEALLEANHCIYPDGDLTRLHDRWSRKANEQEEARKFLNQLKSDIRIIADDWPFTYVAEDFSSAVRELHERWLAIEPGQEFQQQFPLTHIRGANARHLNDFALLKAAVTFHSYGKVLPRFAFHMASRQLCFLKSQSTGVEDSAPVLVTANMYHLLKPNHRQIERLALLRETEGGEISDVDEDEE